MKTKTVTARMKSIATDDISKSQVKRLTVQGALPAVISKAAPLPQPTSLLEALIQASSNPATNIDVMERLYAMHAKEKARQDEEAFNAALSRAQSAIEPVLKTKKNDHTKSNYADLASVIQMVTPIITREGFSLSFDAKAITDPPNWIRTVAKLSHSGGHTREYTLDLPADEAGAKGNANKTGVQAIVSSGTYAQRVIQCRIFNIPLVDNDGSNVKKKDDVEPDKALFDALQKAAQTGTEELRAVWDGSTPELRATCVPFFKQFKKEAAAADALK